MGGEFGGEWLHVYMADSLCCPPEIITILLSVYTPIQNKDFKKLKIKTSINFFQFNQHLLDMYWMFESTNLNEKWSLSKADYCFIKMRL